MFFEQSSSSLTTTELSIDSSKVEKSDKKNPLEVLICILGALLLITAFVIIHKQRSKSKSKSSSSSSSSPPPPPVSSTPLPLSPPATATATI